MRRWMLMAAVTVTLLGRADAQPVEPPHSWVFGSWTGGLFPAGETTGTRCTAQPTVIFTRDVVMRASVFDVAYRQRLIETVASGPDALEFRFAPAQGPSGPLASRLPPDLGFGCPSGPNALRVERRGPNEIVFPNCAEFPSPLARCSGP